jgi:ABC-type iron transport system FetAB permease component
MPASSTAELTERERRIATIFAVSGATLITLLAGSFVLLFVLNAPEWALTLTLVLVGIAAGIGTFLFLRSVGVGRRQALLWGVLVASPLHDLLEFMKDPERPVPRGGDKK